MLDPDRHAPRSLRARLLTACPAIPLLLGDLSAQAASPVSFPRDVRPILSDACFRCHGPDAHTREAELRLDDEADAKRDRDGRRIIDPVHLDQSVLLERIRTTDPELQMPPPESGKHLSEQQRAVLEAWVAAGAPYARHWAYEPPVRAPTPAVRAPGWGANWIDDFILAGLEDRRLVPSVEADRITLLRRASFDLTGLPPTVAQVDEFLADPRPDAFERQVDRLLASDECGERLAMFWLDLVRFADTVGYHGDQDHNISPYRDYVIDAFIRNVPFDQFTREQLAGDLLPDRDDEALIASGYNRMLQTSHEGGVQPREYLAIYAADRVRNASSVWLGATLGCAQCHDHKYDPLTQRDFYSLAAFFADVDEVKHFTAGSNDLPTARPPEQKILTRRERERIAALQQTLEDLRRPQPPELLDAVVARIADLEAEVHRLQASARMTMITQSVPPRTVRILPRGDWLDDSGPEVLPAVPEVFGRLDDSRGRLTRLDLANWLCDPAHGAGLFTARVFVNRLWALVFHEGLSRSLEDFGGQGEPPSHPELLDRLAHEFIDNGWNVRDLLRLMVTSRTYRQSSLVDARSRELDPENRGLGRQHRFRLPAEMVRDTALAASGLLVQEVGGASVKPYQPEGYYRHLNFPERTYTAHDDRRQWRRGLYVHWQRQYLHPMLKAFDAPTREECTAKRPVSNTPLASLVLLNDPTFVEAARVLAEHTLRAAGDTDPARLEYLVRSVLSRNPDEFEQQTLAALLADSRAVYRSDSNAARSVLAVGIAPVGADAEPRELAAWTAVARAVLNTGEAYQRN